MPCFLRSGVLVSLTIFLVFGLYPTPLAAKSPHWQTNSELTTAPIALASCRQSFCPINPDYEMALEKEFWRHVQHEDAKGMGLWLKKTKFYTGHGSHQSERLQQKGRLWMLVAAGHTLMFNQYDLHALVPLINHLKQAQIIKLWAGVAEDFKQIPVLWHLAEAIHFSMKSNLEIPEHQNARTFLFGIGAFAQSALPPIMGVTGPEAAHNTFYGPTCASFPSSLKKIFAGLCNASGLMGPGPGGYQNCLDAESCKQVGAGTEGLFAGALALGLMHDPEKIATSLLMMGDGPDPDSVALCESYWCRFINPNEPNAEFPEASSIAPFKRLGGLMVAAESYGKLEQFNKMERTLAEAYKEAERLDWPFLDLLQDVDSSLHGGDPKRGIPDLLKAWKNPDPRRDLMEQVQFPMPLSRGRRACAACHFGGVMSQAVRY